ncbi:hypothetical protein SAMN05443144_12067 [Fodinibius roseus]|uniref:Transposase n=1 Tax=Fodinibius roseus TaxID=1194090 RepID=A0A1M5HK68_9BACT|nr:hypothetical protein SAMN05443144_12067 [Fodinibius roseus]
MTIVLLTNQLPSKSKTDKVDAKTLTGLLRFRTVIWRLDTDISGILHAARISNFSKERFLRKIAGDIVQF